MRTEARAVAVAAALAACGHGAEEVVITTTPAHAPDRVAPGIPHGGFIQTVATTEQADAALTLDNLGELRLWPTLDGKRPPVPIAATGITSVALGHAGDELLAALLDQSGAAQLLRLGRDGRVHGKAQLPGDVKIEQVVAFDGGVLVVRGDQSIERYDASGTSRGRLLAGSGETLGALSVRHGSAAVLVEIADVPTDDQPPATPTPPSAPLLVPQGRGVRAIVPAAPPAPPIAASLRWIVLGDDLRWGTSVKLPDSIDARALALAPSHRRIGVIQASANVLQVYDLDPLPSVLPGPTLSVTPQGSIGFTDDDHVAVATGTVAWWTAPQAKAARDPWDTTPPNEQPPFMPAVNPDGAVGDGLVVVGSGSGLLLGDPRGTRYLGWKTPGAGTTLASGTGFALVTSATHVLWLDSALVQEAESDVEKLPGGAPQYAVWIDRQHVLVERARDNKYDAELVDLAHPDAKPVRIGSYVTVERFEYDPELHMLSVATTGEVARFAIDAEHDTATPLPALKTSEEVITTRLLDPARADGAIAVATSYEDDGQRLAIYREPKPGAKLVRPEKPLTVRGAVLGIAPTGAVYVKSEMVPYEISVVRAGKVAMKLPPELGADTITAITANHDATRLVLQRASEVSVVDAAGVVQWRAPIWSVIGVTFSSDEHTLLVRTSGGMVALDAATGERRATACAYGFGFADKAPVQSTLGVAPVCEDTPR